LIRVAAIGLGLALAACTPSAPVASCQSQRDGFDAAFKEAAELGAVRDFEHQKAFVTKAQKLYLAMEEQGCCRESPNVCPVLNVR
jgi:hypothetical protein